MAISKGHWDFECPQFVDFVSGLDQSYTEDVFFDSNDHASPAMAKIKRHAAPDMPIKANILTEDAENELMDKMEAALSIIECTPKLPIKKHFSEKTASNHPNSRVVKTAFKRKTIQEPPAGLLRSKSVAALNKITDKENRAKGLRKRSSSLTDLRTNKPKTHPRTPMCLKRTIFKAKEKIKTTEELELEQIAKLQKQLIDHLRYNEMSLKKLKLRPREHTLTQKNIQAKKSQVGGKDTLTEKHSEHGFPLKDTRRNIQKLGHDAVRKEALKLNGIFNSKEPSNKVAEKSSKDNVGIKSKNPSVTSSYISEASEKETVSLKKTNTTKKYGFHSGILFHDNMKKNTVVKAFSFGARNKEMKSHGVESDQKCETWLSSSKLHPRVVGDGKENLPSNKMHSRIGVEKTQGVKNVKCDINKHIGSNKIFEKQIGHQIRGLPLSENIIRKN